MKKVFGRLLVIGLASASLATVGVAYAQGFGHGRHHGDGLVPPIIHQYVTHEQIQAVFQQYGPTLKSDGQAVREARQTLESDLLKGNSVTGDITALESAQSTLLQEKVTVAQAILSNLSSSQRSQVADFVTAYRALQQQDAQNRKALFQQYGISWGHGNSSDTSSTPAE
jgi:hypothetical protein